MLAAARLGIPVIVHLRENLEQHSELAAPPYGLPIVRHWLRHCAGMLVANSLHTANSVLGDLSAWPVTIVPNAVDATFFQFDKTIQECRSQLGLLEDHRVVGIPGTLRPVKGQLDIVQDLAAIVTEHTDVTVLVSGDTTGRYAQEVLDAIRVNHASNNFRFCGMVTDMPQFYRACDVICVPSKDESFGRVVIEAMSMGLPVVASGVGGIPEILVNGVTGLMADGCDCNWMADQIRRLLSDGELRGRLGQAAACDAQLRFSERRHSESIAQIVQQVMS
jgi:glycosyltransferase involved in cell wall biosynthesis